MRSDYSKHDESQVYQPESDTYLLLKAALKEAAPEDRILEVGTGSGYIASEMHSVSKNVTALDINPHACISAKSRGVEVIRSDLFSALKPQAQFDLILFNPPYLPTLPEERIDDWLEYALDGGINGRDTIDKFAAGLSGVMSKHGRCLLLISSLTGIEECRKIFSDKGFISFSVEESKASEDPCDDEMLYVLRISRDICSL